MLVVLEYGNGGTMVVAHSQATLRLYLTVVKKKSGSGQGHGHQGRVYCYCKARRLHYFLTAIVDPFLPTPLVRMM